MEKREDKLRMVSILNLLGFIVEIVGSIAFGSVALLSDAIHMLLDTTAYFGAYSAAVIARKFQKEQRYAIHRIEPLAALLNGILLVPMVGYILWKSYKRFIDPASIDLLAVSAVGVFGLLINVLSVIILHADDESSMSLNERGAYYHLLGDAAGSIMVVLTSVAIYFTGYRIVDPIASIIITVLILWSSYDILKDSSSIFMHDSQINEKDVKGAIREIDKVVSVECLHSWDICSQITAGSVRVKANADTISDIDSTNKKVHEVLSNFGVQHATVEINSCDGSDISCRHNH